MPHERLRCILSAGTIGWASSRRSEEARACMPLKLSWLPSILKGATRRGRRWQGRGCPLRQRCARLRWGWLRAGEPDCLWRTSSGADGRTMALDRSVVRGQPVRPQGESLHEIPASWDRECRSSRRGRPCCSLRQPISSAHVRFGISNLRHSEVRALKGRGLKHASVLLLASIRPRRATSPREVRPPASALQSEAP